MQQVQVLNNNDKNHLVVKSNDFIDAKYSLTIHQSYFLAFMISLIKIDDEDFHDYTIPLNELLGFMDIERKNWKKLERTLDQLQVKQIILSNTDKVIEKVTFLSYFKIDREEDTVLFRFDKTMKPLLLNLKSKFTQVDLKGILNFESSYTIRFYEIIKKYIGFQNNQKDKNYSFIYELEELKEIMVGDYDSKLGKIVYPKSYGEKRYGNFKNKVLLVAQKELKEKSDFYFEFEEQKTKRAVSHLKFTIIFKQKEQKKEEYQEYTEAESIITHNTNHSDLTYEQYCKMKFRKEDFKTVEEIKDKYKNKPFFRPFVMKEFVNNVREYFPWTMVSYNSSQDLYMIDGNILENEEKMKHINAINCFLTDYPQFLGQVDTPVKDLIGWSTEVHISGTSKLGNEVDESQSFKLIEIQESKDVLGAIFENDNEQQFLGQISDDFIEKFKNDKFAIDVSRLRPKPKEDKDNIDLEQESKAKAMNDNISNVLSTININQTNVEEKAVELSKSSDITPTVEKETELEKKQHKDSEYERIKEETRTRNTNSYHDFIDKIEEEYFYGDWIEFDVNRRAKYLTHKLSNLILVLKESEVDIDNEYKIKIKTIFTEMVEDLMEVAKEDDISENIKAKITNIMHRIEDSMGLSDNIALNYQQDK
jgi:plasmid replication initiation protein